MERFLHKEWLRPQPAMYQITLAFDGSAHAAWVGHYAIRLAAAAGTPLRIIHIDDGSPSGREVSSGLRHLRGFAEGIGLDTVVEEIAGTSAGVAAALEGAVPADDEQIIVAGLRATERGRGLLAGTVSESLLRTQTHNVLAIRAVSPGLLGHPRHLLYALSSNPRGARRAALFVGLLGAGLDRLSLLTVVAPRFGGLSHPTPDELAALRARGAAHLDRALARLRRVLPPEGPLVDPCVAVAADWPAQIVRHVGRVGAELVLVGSTERTLPQRVVLGNPLERLLRDTLCDVAIFRRARGAS